MFKQITIIGAGLIGSSVARAAKHYGMAEKVVISDADDAVCQRVQELGFCDGVSVDAQAAVAQADLVVLAVPIGAFDAVCLSIRDHLKPGAIITDVASVKQEVIRAFDLHMPEHVDVVPGHPIAGTEFSGPDSGFAELFHGRWCILTPLAETSIKAVEKLTRFWESFGSIIEIMDAKRHDLVLGITSHLPHLIAYTIVGTASELEDDTKSDVIKFSASGFRDFTRIASSDPIVWRDVFLYNKEAVLEILGRFTEDLSAMQKAVRRGDGAYLENFFHENRSIRHAIIEQGQADYRYPDGQAQAGTPPVVEGPQGDDHCDQIEAGQAKKHHSQA